MAQLRCMGCMREYSERKKKCPYCGYEKVCNPEYSFCMKPGIVLQGRYVVGKTLKYDDREIIYIGWDQVLEKRIAVKEYFPKQLLNRTAGEKLIYLKESDCEKTFQYGKEQYIADVMELAKFREETGIIRIYDYFEENGTVYVITEYSENYRKDNVETRLLYSRKKKKKQIVRYMWYWLLGIEIIAVASIFICVLVREKEAYRFLENEMLSDKRIPDVIGEDYEQARQELEALGVDVQKEDYPTDEVKEGMVLRQSLDWGIMVQDDIAITLVVSKEKETENHTSENHTNDSSSEESSSEKKSTQTVKKQQSTTEQKTTKKEKATAAKKDTNQSTTEKTTEVIVIED
ncbi:MAG: PASTA domain-containing protein [Lachnospiraceae bacterium]